MSERFDEYPLGCLYAETASRTARRLCRQLWRHTKGHA